MPLIPVKCTSCGANLEVDTTKEFSGCQYCGSVFIIKKPVEDQFSVQVADVRSSDPASFSTTEMLNDQTKFSAFNSGNAEQNGAYIAPDLTSSAQIVRPSNKGQIVFSIVNIISVTGPFCIISMILGTFAMVMAIRSSGTSTEQESRDFLKKARIFNIIGVISKSFDLIFIVMFYFSVYL